MKLLICFSFIINFSYNVESHNPVAINYIENYVSIAQSEMQRTGIPASIKMAQAILESDMGRSDLATEANNHFGIKCGGSWNGEGFYKHDDDKNHKGEIIESCFRKFDSVEESFIAHSEFLTDEKKINRYGFLFESIDYKKWSKGLRKAGYATDPDYPEKLISIIEKYELYKYDDISYLPSKSKDIVKSNSNTYNNYNRYTYEIETENRLKFVLALGGETYKEIANSAGISLDDILNYNEAFDKRTYNLKEGDRVYVSSKKRSYNGSQEKHLVKEGESMYSISQLYGIKLAALYGKNKMPKGTEPLIGEYLFLQKTVDSKERPKYSKLKETDTEVLVWE